MTKVARVSQPGLTQKVERSIFIIREQRVMLDRDLAALYGVSTARLNEQVRRNIALRVEGRAIVTPSTKSNFGLQSVTHYLGTVGLSVLHLGTVRKDSDGDGVRSEE